MDVSRYSRDLAYKKNGVSFRKPKQSFDACHSSIYSNSDMKLEVKKQDPIAIKGNAATCIKTIFGNV